MVILAFFCSFEALIDYGENSLWDYYCFFLTWLLTKIQGPLCRRQTLVWNLQKTAEPHFHTTKFYIKQFHWRIEEIYKFLHSKLGLTISCFLFLQCPSGRISNTNIFRQTNLVLILQKHHTDEHSGFFTSLEIHPPRT